MKMFKIQFNYFDFVVDVGDFSKNYYNHMVPKVW